MAVLALTGTPGVLSQLVGNASVQVALARGTAHDNGDGTWSIVGYADEDQIAALQALGITVEMVKTDAQQLADYEVVDSQIDDNPVA